MNRIILHNHAERPCWFTSWQIKCITCKDENGFLASLDSLPYSLNDRRHLAGIRLTTFTLLFVFLTVWYGWHQEASSLFFLRYFFFCWMLSLISKLGRKQPLEVRDEELAHIIEIIQPSTQEMGSISLYPAHRGLVWPQSLTCHCQLPLDSPSVFPATSARSNRKEVNRERCHHANSFSWTKYGNGSFDLKVWSTDQISRHLPISNLTVAFSTVGAQPDEKICQKKFFCLTRI